MKCYDSTPSFQVGGVGLTPIICSKLWERLGFLLHWLLSSGVENSTYGGVKMVKLYSDKNIFCKINTKKKQSVNRNNVGATPAAPTYFVKKEK